MESVNKGRLLKSKILSRTNAPSRAQRVLHMNDILFQSVRPYQKNNYLFRIADGNQYVASTGYIQLRTNYNPLFIYQLLNTDRFIASVMLRCTGTSYPAINSNDFSTIPIYICKKEEQTKIANLLSKIDQRIDTQMKIINDYYSLKKAIIQRIFNASAQYSKVHLDIILKEISKKNKEQIHNNVLSVSNSLGFVKQSEQFVDREIASSDTSNYKIVNKNEYAYNPARINVGSIARLTNYDCGIVSPMYTVFEINTTRIIYEYFDYFLHSFTFQKQLNQRLEGSVRQCLTFNSMKNIEIELPPIEVQIEISKNMKQLDSKKKIESDYLNLNKSKKNYLLKIMFI